MSKKNMMKGAAKSTGKSFVRELNPIQALKEILTSYVEWKRICESEKTKRTEIEADKEVMLAEIRAKEKMFLDYMDKAFSERKENFKSLFRMADEAIETNNTEALSTIMVSFTELVKSSPLKDMMELKSVMVALSDKNHSFKL